MEGILGAHGQSSQLQLEMLNARLEREVHQLRREVERLMRLKRFVAPQISDLVLSDEGASLLRSHQREVVVVFFDLRGFTGFVQSAGPDEVIETLHAYHRLIGRLAHVYQATVERFTGDGVMVFFNDPVVVAEPAQRAVGMALAVRDSFRELSRTWAQRGITLGLGIGVSQGLATVGAIGSEERCDYAAIGTVTNLAARLCAAAQSGQILVCEQVAASAGTIAKSRRVGDLALSGFPRPVSVFDVATLSAT